MLKVPAANVTSAEVNGTAVVPSPQSMVPENWAGKASGLASVKVATTWPPVVAPLTALYVVGGVVSVNGTSATFSDVTRTGLSALSLSVAVRLIV